MKKWDKNQWANSYEGSVLTTTGDEVITDKEISSKVTELETKFQENTFKIDNCIFKIVFITYFIVHLYGVYF